MVRFMRKIAFFAFILVVAAVSASGCVGGTDYSEWNDQIDVINSYVNKSVALGDAIETAYDSGNYELALDKVDERLDELDSAYDEIQELRDIADDYDEDFLIDYSSLWSDHTEQIVTYNENLRNAILVSNILSYEDDANVVVDMALGQYLDSQDFFNSANYQAAASTAELSKQKWSQVYDAVAGAEEYASLLGVGFIEDYTGYQVSASDNAIKAMEYLKLSANAAKTGSIDTANLHLDTHNFYDAALAADLQSIQDVRAMNPEAFADEDNYFQNIADNYLAAMDAAEAAAADISDDLDDIESEHSDFFEER